MLLDIEAVHRESPVLVDAQAMTFNHVVCVHASERTIADRHTHLLQRTFRVDSGMLVQTVCRQNPEYD